MEKLDRCPRFWVASDLGWHWILSGIGFWVALDFEWHLILGGIGFWVAQRFSAAITGLLSDRL